MRSGSSHVFAQLGDADTSRLAGMPSVIYKGDEFIANYKTDKDKGVFKVSKN